MSFYELLRQQSSLLAMQDSKPQYHEGAQGTGPTIPVVTGIEIAQNRCEKFKGS